MTNVINGHAAIEKCLSHLRNVCRWYRFPAEGFETARALEEIGKRLRTSEFGTLFEYLGLSIGGFLYLDQDAKTVHYEFFADAKGEKQRRDLVYMIPYQAVAWTPDGREVDPALAQEYSEAVDSLFYIQRKNQNPFSVGGSFSDPEYLRSLPLHDEDEDATETCVRRTFGIHYVPYGEMIAYMLAWRRLLHRCTDSSTDIWRSDYWTRANRTYEQELSRVMVGPPPSYLAAHASLKRVVDMLEGEAKDWSVDLAALLILDENGRPSVGFHALQRYLQLSGLRVPIECEPRSFADLADELLALPKFGSLASDGADNFGKALRSLHTRSRFPILPYYYWSALARRPRCHAVLPIWASISAPLESPFFTPIVGVAVVDLRPLGGLDLTMPDSDAICDEEQRLRDLTAAVRLISQPQIDAFYYRRLKLGTAAAAAHLEMLDSFGHDFRKPIEDVRSCLIAIGRSDDGLTTEERVRLAVGMIDGVLERIEGYSAIRATFTEDECRRLLRLDQEHASDFISMHDLATETWSRALLRFTFTAQADAAKWLALEDRTVVDFWREWTTLRMQRSPADGAPRIPYTVAHDFNRGGVAFGRTYCALRFIFAEIFENFLKHDAAKNRKFDRPLHWNLQTVRIGDSPDGAALYELTIRLGPVTAASPDRSGRSVGLVSLRRAAESIGAHFGKSRSEELPYFEARNDCREWIINGVAVYER